jgi:hypothetical protein
MAGGDNTTRPLRQGKCLLLSFKWSPGTDVMIIKIFLQKLALLTQSKAKLFKNFIITLSKIAEKCDHNIDPQLPEAGSL